MTYLTILYLIFYITVNCDLIQFIENLLPVTCTCMPILGA